MDTIETTKLSRSPHRIDNDSHLLPIAFRSLNRIGTKKLFTPAQLYQKANDYFEQCKHDPIYSPQLITGGQSAGTVIDVKKPRMFTIEGFCLFCQINTKYLNDLEDQIKGKEDDENVQYSHVIKYIRDIIRQQRFEFAAVREFDAMFIAKLEGLTDKVEHSGEVTNKVVSITFTSRTVEDADFSEVQDALDQE